MTIEKVQAELDALVAEASTLAAVPEGASTALEFVGNGAQSRAVEMASRHAALDTLKTSIEVKSKELRDLMEQKLREQLAVLAPMKAELAKLQDGIQAVELYLGAGEEVTCLRDGEPAPVDTTITVRQMVLGMDEECAVTEDGGVTARTAVEFYDWLLADPANVDQVIPETKGVVAIRARRHPRDYGDPWVNAQRNAEDAHAYFLCRNGEQLHVVYAEYNTGNRLVPSADEFTDMFTGSEWVGNEYVKVKLQPGSYQWEQAEKAADKRLKHYMKLVLILQGLMDRTTVFHPLPATGISFADPDSYDAGHVAVITDADNTLGTGFETFREWQTRLNAELRPGMRVLANFNSREWREETSEKYQTRRHPNYADNPESDELHMIEDTVYGMMVIRYKRTELVWDHRNYEMREPKTRASCKLAKTDRFVLPFDLLTEADINRFLRSRSDRRDYLTMFPLLKTALKLKAAEQAAEAPFKLMLTGVIATRNNVPVADVEPEIDDLVFWWKNIRKDHRTLVTGDSTSVDAIVAEHAKRVKDRARRRNEPLIGRLANMPDTLLVARKRSGVYVTITAHGDGPYVTVTEYNSKGVPGHTVEWVQALNRHLRWQILWEPPRWADWKRFVSRTEYLTGPDKDAVVAHVVDHGCKGDTLISVQYNRAGQVDVFAYSGSKEPDGRGGRYIHEHRFHLWFEDGAPVLRYRDRGLFSPRSSMSRNTGPTTVTDLLKMYHRKHNETICVFPEGPAAFNQYLADIAADQKAGDDD